MAGGGKGGTKSQKIDPGLTAAARDALDFAAAAAAVPYSPNMGVQFAAFTPQQQAAFQGANSAATAFGLPSAGPTSMPKPKTSASGIKGYSTAADYQQIKNQSMSSGLQAALDALFANKKTGATAAPPNSPLYKGRYAAMPGIEGGGK